jgi:hypothetical protein
MFGGGAILSGAGPAASQLPRVRQAAKVHWTFAKSAGLTPSPKGGESGCECAKV